MRTAQPFKALICVYAMMLGGCAAIPSAPVGLSGAEPALIDGMGPCGPAGRRSFEPNQPITVLVHGCKSSGRKLKQLAQVLENRGEQTICFSYDHRSWVSATGRRLNAALAALTQTLKPSRVTVLGHSQGGLVARSALTETTTPETTPLRLVTVSSPLGGIQSAADCGRTWLHVLSFGLTMLVCKAIAGDMWTEVYPRAPFITQPRSLPSGVTQHLMIATDETGTCRRVDEQGRCREDDFVFNLEEQSNPAVEADRRVERVELAVGHAAAVGEYGGPPRDLLKLLEAHDVFAPPETPSAIAAFEAVLLRAYAAPSP